MSKKMRTIFKVEITSPKIPQGSSGTLERKH